MRSIKAVLSMMFFLGLAAPIYAWYSSPLTPNEIGLEQHPGFGVFDTSYATIYFQDGVSSQRVAEIESAFEVAHAVVVVDLANPDVRPRIYAYRSLDDLSNDLVDYWGYPEWIRTFRAIPRMNAVYEMWVPPDTWAEFIGHEYTHRIIEQIAGLNSQVNYKWFDEGLAMEEGLRTLAVISPGEAASQRVYYRNATKEAYWSGTYIPLSNLTTDAQWVYWMQGPYVQYIYSQAAAIMEYLANQSGMGAAKLVLLQIGQGNPFPIAFETACGKTIDQFESEFLTGLSLGP